MAEKDIFDESIEELIRNMVGPSIPMSYVEQKKALIQRHLIKQLSDSLDRNSTSASTLARVLIWLNALIAIASTVGVVLTALALCR